MTENTNSISARLKLCGKYFKSPQSAWFVAVTGMVIVSVCEPLVPALLKPLLDKGFVSGDLNVWLVPVALIGIFITRSVGSFIAQIALAKIANHGVLQMRLKLFDKLLKTDAKLYSEESAGSIINTMIHETQAGANLMVNSLLTLGRDSLTLLALLAFLIYTNWQLIVVVGLLFPALFWTIRKTTNRLGRLNQESLDSNDRLAYAIEENVLAYREIRLQGAQKQQADRFQLLSTQTFRLFMKAMTASALITPLTQILSALALSAVISFALIQSNTNGTTVGEFAAFVTGMLMLVAPIKHLSEVVGPMNRGLTSLERAIYFMDRYPNERGGSYRSNRLNGLIEYTSTSVTFPEMDHPAIVDINLTIQPGQTVAFVGASGAGKTTLVNVLPRWISPSSGSIKIDHVSIDQYDLEFLRHQIGMVSQHVIVMNDSLFNNVCLGQIPDKNKAIRCLESANLGEWLLQLPQGIDTIVGHNASKLSGGQKQRLAITRAMYKDSPILILDEATSALDNESERLVQEALNRLSSGRTTLIVAHRLSTIEKADLIVVMDKGRIVEKGQHRDLLEKKNLYHTLFNSKSNSDEI